MKSRNLQSNQNLQFIFEPLDNLKMTSDFGPRIPPFPGASSDHKGIDLAGTEGVDKVYAPFDGTIIRAGTSSSMGNYVMIQDPISGKAVSFNHLSNKQFGDIYKGNGQAQISAGTVIGNVGKTGTAQKAHLHLEVYSKNDADKVKNNPSGPSGQYLKTGTLDLDKEDPIPYFKDLAINQALLQLSSSDPNNIIVIGLD